MNCIYFGIYILINIEVLNLLGSEMVTAYSFILHLLYSLAGRELEIAEVMYSYRLTVRKAMP